MVTDDVIPALYPDWLLDFACFYLSEIRFLRDSQTTTAAAAAAGDEGDDGDDDGDEGL